MPRCVITSYSIHYTKLYESPLVKAAKINLDNGKILTIIAKNQSEENVYVKRVLVNGALISNNQITHNDIESGGEIIFEMSKEPNN